MEQQTLTTYRCPKASHCPLHKKCFVLKLPNPLKVPMDVFQKCPAKHGEDILIQIGASKPP